MFKFFRKYTSKLEGAELQSSKISRIESDSFEGDFCSKFLKTPTELRPYQEEDFTVTSTGINTSYLLDSTVNIQLSNDKIVIIPKDKNLRGIVITPKFIGINNRQLVLSTKNSEYTLKRNSFELV